MASKHPQLFSAIIPVVGWGHPDLMKPIAQHRIPVWAFAGGRDQVVQLQFFYAGLNKLESLGHDNVRFTVHEDMSHDAWTRVYASTDIYEWMLQQAF
jgi:predicted peptidase